MDAEQRLRIDRAEDRTGTGGSELRVAGELDAYTAPSLEALLGEVAEDTGSRVRLHLGGVEFIDSTGIRVIVWADQVLRDAGGELVVVDPSPSVARLFELTALDEMLRIESAT